MVGGLEGFTLPNFRCLFLRIFNISKDLGNKSMEFSVWFVIKCWPSLQDEMFLEHTT